MENKLKALFAFHDFQENSHLAQVIFQTESRYGNALNDDDLSFVNAAGEYPQQHRKGGDGFNA